MKIERNDARKVDQKTLQFLRNRTIKLREAGHSNKEVAAILGTAVETTSRWYSSYKKNGQKAIKVKKVGRLSSAIQKYTNMQCKSAPLSNTFI